MDKVPSLKKFSFQYNFFVCAQRKKRTTSKIRFQNERISQVQVVLYVIAIYLILGIIFMILVYCGRHFICFMLYLVTLT